MKKHTKFAFVFLLFIAALIMTGCPTKSLLWEGKSQEVLSKGNNQETFDQEQLDILIKQKKDEAKKFQEEKHGRQDEEKQETQRNKSGLQAESKSESKEQIKIPSSDVISPELEFSKCIYLTFDDGPSEVTGEILNVLKKHDIKATFFVNGDVDENRSFYSQMIHRIVEEGHALGNHGYSHDYHVSYASKKVFKDNVDKLNLKLEGITGVKPTLYRFQGGSSNTVYKRYLKDATMRDLFKLIVEDGFRYFDWNVDARDSEEDAPSATRTIKYALKGVEGKTDAIVLMHDSEEKTETPEAVDFIIKKLREQEYRFDKLSMDSFNFQHRK